MFNKKLLKNQREAKGLTQTELAEKVGTTKQNIYKYEAGIITNVPIPRIEAIANVLGIAAEELAGWGYSDAPINPKDEYNFECSPDEIELLLYYRAMPDIEKGRLLGELSAKYGNML